MDLGVMRVLSDLVNRAALMARGGSSYGGKRNMNEVLGYDDVLDAAKCRQRFDRGEIAGRVVEAFPKATWRGGGELIEDENPEVVTEFEKAWIDLDARLHFWPSFERTDILSGIGRYAVLLIGTPGELDQPLKKVSGPQDIIYLRPFGEERATFSDNDVVKETKDPRFGRPNFYTLSQTGAGSTTNTRRVHYTRVIHVCENPLEDDFYGRMRLARVWNRLDDLDKIAGGGSEAFWLKASRGLQFDIDPKLAVETGDVEALKQQIELYQHGLLRALRTRGVTINDLGTEVANFDKSIASIVGLICAGAEIPQRILMGSERGQLASEQDDRNWEQRVSDRRKSFADPFVVRASVDRLIELNALPKPKQYAVRWPESMELDDIEKVDLALKMAQVNKDNGSTVITSNEIRDRALGWAPMPELDDEQRARAEQAVNPPAAVSPEDQEEKAQQQQRAARVRAKVVKLQTLRDEAIKRLRRTG